MLAILRTKTVNLIPSLGDREAPFVPKSKRTNRVRHLKDVEARWDTKVTIEFLKRPAFCGRLNRLMPVRFHTE